MSKRHFLPIGLLSSLIFIFCGGIIAVWMQAQINAAQATMPGVTLLPPDAADKRYGVTIDLRQYNDETRLETLDALQAAGLVWLRQPVYWDEVEPEPREYEFTEYDSAINAARRFGFEIMLVLQHSPDWARPENSLPQTPPTDVTDMADFARRVALRYGAQVNHYQVWHEPNLSSNWGNRHVSAAEYAYLLKNVARSIRAVDSEALILSAALAPTTATNPLNLNEVDYLISLYEANAAPDFDILAAQLYGFHLPAVPVERDPALLSIHRVTYLREVMVAHGDAEKAIWGVNFGWNALPSDWAGQASPWPTDTTAKQRERTAEAIAYARSNWPWLGPMLAVRWDTVGLSADDPAGGFAIAPHLQMPFTEAAAKQRQITTIGAYPATHGSARYSPDWRFAADAADAPPPTFTVLGNPIYPTLTIPFEGTRLDLTLAQGDYRGFVRISIDGQPSQVLPRDEQGFSFVPLYNPDGDLKTVTIADYLPDGPHEAVIAVDGSWGQWALRGWQVYRTANIGALQTARSLALLVLVLGSLGFGALLLGHRQTVWPSMRYIACEAIRLGYLLPDRVSIALIFGLGLAILLAPPLPSLLLLPVLGLMFLLRPDLGVLLVSFSISFFLVQKSLVLRSVGMTELLLWLLTLATIIRTLITPPSTWPRRHAADIGVIALVILGLISTMAAVDTGPALYEWRTVFLGAGLFYALLRLIPSLEKQPAVRFNLRLVDSFVAGAVLHAILALWQYGFQPEQTIAAQDIRRAIGYLYGSPNNLALFLGRAWPILLAIGFTRQSGQRRLWYLGGAVVLGSALGLTFSIAALILSMPLVILFMTVMGGGLRGWRRAGMGLFLFAFALLPISRTARFQNTVSLQPDSTGFLRLRLWQSTWQMIQDYPWLGVGPDNFLYVYRSLYLLPSAWADPNLSHPHNFLLDFTIRLGFGGLALLFFLQWHFWRVAWQLWRQHTEPRLRALILGLMGSMLAFLSHGLVDNAFFLVDLALTFCLSLAVLINLHSDLQSGK